MMAFGGVMDTNDIIKQIDTEISNLQQARAILIGVAPAKKGPGRPKLTEPIKKRKLSAKGRAAISAAMKARWAAKREAVSPKVKKTVKGAKS
jgi:hypothetical protein